jgi:hypothetical protein
MGGMIIVAGAMLLAGAAPPPGPDADFARFVEATETATPPPAVAEIKAGALDIVQQVARANGDCVPTDIEVEPVSPAAATPMVVQLVRSGEIKNGWTAYGRAKGCVAPARIRFILLRRSTGVLLVRIVNSGESLANPSLMRDSSTGVAMAALVAIEKAHPDCSASQQMKMEGSRIVSRGADLGPDYHGAFYAGSWEEAWTFKLCGHSVEIPIGFVADGKGGANWSVHADQAKPLD